jgi:hypothetical protein
VLGSEWGESRSIGSVFRFWEDTIREKFIRKKEIILTSAENDFFTDIFHILPDYL